MSFKKYHRTNVGEMRVVTQADIELGQDELALEGISISKADLDNGSPKLGDQIARNPKNHKDQWLVAGKYFKNNFKEIL